MKHNNEADETFYGSNTFAWTAINQAMVYSSTWMHTWRAKF